MRCGIGQLLTSICLHRITCVCCIMLLDLKCDCCWRLIGFKGYLSSNNISYLWFFCTTKAMAKLILEIIDTTFKFIRQRTLGHLFGFNQQKALLITNLFIIIYWEDFAYLSRIFSLLFFAVVKSRWTLARVFWHYFLSNLDSPL